MKILPTSIDAQGSEKLQKNDAPSNQLDGPSEVLLIPPGHPQRVPSEEFIAENYFEHFNAHITNFLPHLMVLKNRDGEIRAALGIRQARPKLPLFLEQYLPQPVEKLLTEVSGNRCCRMRCAEIGNLAAASSKDVPWLYYSLTALLDGWGYQWAVFTATAPIRWIFKRLSVPLIDLGPADPALLVNNTEQWGSYYDYHPRVTAAEVTITKEALQRQQQFSESGSSLWLDAYTLGNAAGPVCGGHTCKAR